MTFKKYLGWFGILSFVLITSIIWARIFPLSERFANYETTTHSLGQIGALIGTVLFALTFVLTTRLNVVEDLFNGLDKVYKAHHLLGVGAFVLLLFHPILLVLKFIPNNIHQAAVYLWPSGSSAVNYGIIALLGMILLIFLTFFINLKYKTWKNSHRFMGAVFLIACLHIFLVPTDITISFALRNWMIFVCAIGMSAHVYGSYAKKILIEDYEYKVVSVKGKNKVIELELDSIGSPMKFKPGQFIFVSFEQKGFEEKHPFTISSAPGKSIKLSIKEDGDYTSKLRELKIGTKALIEGPYGRFTALEDNDDQIWIAGGIGITPFLAFADDISSKKKENNKKIDLFYCVSRKEDAIFMEKLIDFKNKINNFEVHLFCSADKGRISARAVQDVSEIKNKSIYICGPLQMSRSLKEQFKALGIRGDSIKMEEFKFDEN